MKRGSFFLCEFYPGPIFRPRGEISGLSLNR
nr:MAG TPA: hypothetical protein [Caudoviricetes sp.]